MGVSGGSVPLVFHAPALADQAQQGFWRGADAGEEQMTPGCCAAVARGGGDGGGDHLDDPAAARPVRLGVLRCLFGSEFPERVTAGLFLLIRCGERDGPLSLELGADLSVAGLLDRFADQEHVGPLLQAPLKNGRVVCGASAWISTPCSSRVLSSSLSAARSLES